MSYIEVIFIIINCYNNNNNNTDAAWSLFAANNVTLPDISQSSIVLLGAPLSVGPHLDSILVERREERLLLSKRLQLIPAHDSMFLLRNVLTAPRLMHLLQSKLCIDSPVLPLYDAVLRESLSATLNIDLDDIRWSQASLPIKWGGLGVRGVVLLAPSAYLARPDGVTLVPWKRGRCLAWDATCPDTYAQSAIHGSGVQAGSAVRKAEVNKSRKYTDIIAGVDFILPSRPREFGACRPWSWYPRLVDV